MTTIASRELSISIGAITLRGVFRVPAEAIGIVLFAHGSGSGRQSPRNTYVAERLSEARLATLLLDLLTSEEEETPRPPDHLPSGRSCSPTPPSLDARISLRLPGIHMS